MTKESAEKRFSRLATALTRSGYSDFFQSLTQELAAILAVDYVMIADTRANAMLAETLAVCAHGRIIDNFSYSLLGTPCETVPERELCSYADGVAERFPDDALLADLSVQSYFGMPILTSAGRKLGLVGVMACRPHILDDTDREILRIAAAQVGAELELSMTHDRIRSLTTQDRITGLPNRESLAGVSWRGMPSVRLLLLDLRRFKEVNDLHSHAFGDAVLRTVAGRLQERVGERGIVARFSSDEFAVIPHAQWNNESHEIVYEIRSWFTDPFRCEGRDVYLDVTLGVAELSDAVRRGVAEPMSELARQASVALAEAKAMGKSAEFYTPSMADTLARRQALYERLIKAVRTNKLRLHYQPQVCLQSGQLTGAEALCRWYDDDYGWISPGVFIPLAEERGLITELGAWVIAQAGSQLERWSSQGLSFPGKLAINVSNKQLEAADVVQTIRHAVGATPPEKLLLELTESAVMHAPELNLRQMHLLRSAGFAWAVDDFGTGHSSLSYLTRMDAEVLKIDLSFVARVPGSMHDETVIRTIVAMGRSMGMGLLAEGIETRAQLDYLRSAGCDRGQGYFIDRPLPADEFAAKWLAALQP